MAEPLKTPQAVPGANPTRAPATAGQTTSPATRPAAPVIKAAPFKIQSLQKRDRWFNAAFYGAHGVGKTELAGTAVDVPDMCDVLCISAEKGTMTIDETDRIFNKDAFFEIPVDDIETLERIRAFLVAHCKYRELDSEADLQRLELQIGFRQEGETHPAKRFRTIVVDTVTEIQQFSLSKQLGISGTLAFDAEIPDTDWPIYNKMLARMQMLMRAFRDLPIHCMFLFQEDYKQDETKKMIYTPMMFGKMATRVAGYVDLCGRLELGKGADGKDIRRLWLQPIAKNSAKNRFGKFKDPYMDDATLPKLLKCLTTGQSLLSTET